MRFAYCLRQRVPQTADLFVVRLIGERKLGGRGLSGRRGLVLQTVSPPLKLALTNPVLLLLLRWSSISTMAPRGPKPLCRGARCCLAQAARARWLPVARASTDELEPLPPPPPQGQ